MRPTHWTYDVCPEASDLEQGDLIKPTPAIRDVFEKYHRYFVDDKKYTLFTVSTQSCDLVRRGGEADASYITLAVVRPLRQVTSRLMTEVAPSAGAAMYRASGRERWKEFLSRLLNQNEQKLGLFYLHKDSDAGVDEECVAFLRVTVALQAQHYDALVAARVGRLRPAFQAKLGWLLGNLFARPATPDWIEQVPDGPELLKQLIGDLTTPDGIRWVDDVIVDAAKKSGQVLDGKNDAELEALRPKPPIAEAVDVVVRDLRSALGKDAPADVLEKVRKRLMENDRFKRFFPTGS